MKLLMLIVLLIEISPTWAKQDYVPLAYPPLKIENTFNDPLKVLKYYLERDAYGFIWSGLLNIERTEFTQWKKAPQSESFWIANKYIIKKLRSNSTEVLFEVTYDLDSLSDQYQTRIPANQKQLKVKFQLDKIGGKWKIVSPQSDKIVPIVIKGKFDR